MTGKIVSNQFELHRDDIVVQRISMEHWLQSADYPKQMKLGEKVAIGNKRNATRRINRNRADVEKKWRSDRNIIKKRIWFKNWKEKRKKKNEKKKKTRSRDVSIVSTEEEFLIWESGRAGVALLLFIIISFCYFFWPIRLAFVLLGLFEFFFFVLLLFGLVEWVVDVDDTVFLLWV